MRSSTGSGVPARRISASADSMAFVATSTVVIGMSTTA